MKKIELLEIAKTMLSYCPETGEFQWHTPPKSKNYLIGARAGSQWMDGYRYIRILGVPILEHRAAWFFAYGVEPKQIDHINMDRSDNRLENLREATHAQNCTNRGLQSNNSTGHKGVSLHKKSGRFSAKIMSDGRSKSLGYFDTAAEAGAAYQAAANELHGDFARSGKSKLTRPRLWKNKHGGIMKNQKQEQSK